MSVVLCIPTLSEAGSRRTAALIESVMAPGQLAPDRVFVVDNGGHFSTTTTDVWRSVHRVRVLTPNRNMGVGPAWNEALRRFPDSFVIFANDDIAIAPDSIERLVEGAYDGSKMVATSGHSFSLFLMRPELVDLVGYFDEGFAPAYYEDTDYLRRMKLAGVERKIVDTGSSHSEQSTSRDMGWDARSLIGEQSVRYQAKWGGLEGSERHAHPWGIDIEVCVPSCQPSNLQRLIDSLAWQTARPSAVTIATNADIPYLFTRGLRVRQVKFWSDAYAIGEGDVSLRRNVATWAADAPYIVYSDDDQVWPQNAMEWFRRRFSTGEHFVVGHHRFIEGLDKVWPELRSAPPERGVSRERYANQDHLWQSCWGGAVGLHSMLIKYGVGGWDMGFSNGEDQQLARRVAGAGDDSTIRVYEPPWAWHEKDAVHSPPWAEPHRNTCERGAHSFVTVIKDGEEWAEQCTKCPLIRRLPDRWHPVSMFDASKVRTETSWL